MIPLAFPFERDQYVHRLVERDGMIAIVERTSTHPDSRGKVHWEVIVVRTQPVRRLGGRTLPASERYPGSSDWGTYGWTYTSEADARVRYDRLRSLRQGGQQPRKEENEP